jgi:hypothetical protein
MTPGEIYSIIWAMGRHDEKARDDEEKERIFAEVYEMIKEAES